MTEGSRPKRVVFIVIDGMRRESVTFLSTLADPPLRPSTVDVAPHILRLFRSLKT